MSNLKLCAALLAAVSASGVVWAEGAAPLPSSDAAANVTQGTLEEVIVTAEKRASNLQETPVAVTALGGVALSEAQVRALPDIASLVPNFQMGEANGYAQITLRGIGISNFTPGAESAVALNQNEVYVSRPIAQLTGLYDISSIEVLRGPQGTLYGRNATAGAVNITTNRPTKVWSGYANATVGDFGLQRIEGAIGGPIVGDQLLFRVAAFRERRDGYGKNLTTGNDVDDKHADGVRGTLVFAPTDNFNATLIGEYFKEEDNGAGLHYFGGAGLIPAPGALGIPPVFILLGGVPPSDPRDVANGVDPLWRLRTSAVTGILDWGNGPFSVKSITGYRDQKSLTVSELEGGSSVVGSYGSLFVGGEPAHQLSQELQAHYDTSRSHFTAGLFYFSEHDDYAPGAVPVSNLYLNLALPMLPQRPVGGVTNFGQVGGLYKTRAEAAFAEATVNVTEALSLTAGIRYSDERKQIFSRYAIDLFAPYTGPDQAPPAAFVPPRTFVSTTPKAGVQYRVNPDTMVYFTYAKGFKSGGFDRIGISFRPEKLTDYEGGVKSTFLDNRLRLNVAGFYYDYTDLQVQQVQGTTDVITTNAGSARNFGAEVEVTAVVTPAFTVDANASWLHARYQEYSGPDNALPLLSSIDFNGNRLSNAPDFRVHLGGAYTWSMDTGRIVLRAEGDYSSSYYFSPANVSVVGQGAYTKANAFLTYNANSGWHATAFVRNATNKLTRTSEFVSSILFGTPAEGAYAPPRTYGVEVGYNF